MKGHSRGSPLACCSTRPARIIRPRSSSNSDPSSCSFNHFRPRIKKNTISSTAKVVDHMACSE
ncbi:Uncharacterised protein [Vibrio cholerae]|nr:Uncharacterised protein [Vibrio cholerae]CSI95149.1 Uncharacterised protein [Vibrio cholerae]